MNQFFSRGGSACSLPSASASGTKRKIVSLAQKKNFQNQSKVAKPKAKPKAEPEQMLLDFGQRSLGRQKECGMCGLLYCPGDKDDEKAHAAQCDPFRKGVLIANPWPSERVVAESSRSAVASSTRKSFSSVGGVSDCSRVIEVRAGDSPRALAKAAEVHAIIIAELGCSLDLATPHGRTYLLVRDRRVVACLVAEHIERAYRLCAHPTTPTDEAQSPQLEATSSSSSTSDVLSTKASVASVLLGARSNCPVDVSSADSTPRSFQAAHATPTTDDRAFSGLVSAPGPALETSTAPITGSYLGVRAIWVHSSQRRQGGASRLLDAARRTLVFGTVLPRSACAFTAPTEDGRAFALTYCGSRDLFLFNP